MKKITIKLIGFLILFLSLTINAQRVYITNTEYQGVSTPNCGTINLGSENPHTIIFGIRITRPYHDVYGNPNTLDESGVVNILYTTYYGTFDAADPIDISVNSVWTIENNSLYVIEGTVTATLYSSEISESGGILYAEYDTPDDYDLPYQSECDISFTVPKFKINPTNKVVACGSTGETFTVSNENNSPGNLTYQWNVGNGWSDTNGNSVSNFTTTSNSVTLIPTSFPPSNVKVKPKLDGVSYPQLTSTVSLAPFNPTNEIVLNGSSCSSLNLSISDLPNDYTVTNWSVSNTNIATVSNTNGNQTTLNVIGRGYVTINVVLTNSCNQSKPLTKRVYVGKPKTPSKIFGPRTVGLGVMARYSTPTIEGATSYEWRLPYPYQTVTYFNYNNGGWQLLASTSNSRQIMAFSGYDGVSGYVQVWGKNSCGKGGAKYIRVRQNSIGGGQYIRGTSQIDEISNVTISPNPATNKIKVSLDNFKSNDIYKIQIFNMKNILMKEIETNSNVNNIEIEDLNSGIYIVKIKLGDKTLEKKLVIN